MSEALATLRDLVAGTIGACCGIVAGQPLDTVKVRLQSQKGFSGPIDCLVKTVRRDGVRALYNGMGPPLVGNMPMNAIVFACYGNSLRTINKFYPMSAEQELSGRPAYARLFVAGSWAGLVQCLIKCRLQVQGSAAASSAAANLGSASGYTGPVECARAIVRQRGWRGMYRGWWATVCRDCPGYGAYWAIYEGAKHTFSAGQAPTNTALLSAGAVAGVTTWIMTYPFDCVKSVVQTAPDNTPPRELRLSHVVTEKYRTEGLRFFTRGLGTTIVRAVPVNAVTFFVYEKMLKALGAK